jgi:hypothetical protein
MNAARTALAATIQAQFDEWDDGPPAAEPVIFGTIDAQEIAALADRFCAETFGSSVVEPLFYRSSVGAVFGVALTDGRRVVVKAHQPDADRAFLEAVHAVQHRLGSQGFPCPQPLLAPTPFARGFATAETLLDQGDYQDAHQPWVRRAITAALAEQVRLAAPLASHPGFRASHYASAGTDPDRLFPKPHSAMFDFEATSAGAEWIDDLARRAKLRVAALADQVGPLVVGHSDWSTKHFRFVDTEIRAVYDWDSLRLASEPVVIGRGAHAHCAAYDTPLSGTVHNAPSYEEVVAFIEGYEAARGEAFTPAQRSTAAAACVYSLAYSSRCSHSLDPQLSHVRTFEPGTWRDSLATFGERLLEL